MPLPTGINNLKIAQFANALYATVVGTTTNAAVLADIASTGSFNTTVNTYYAYTFGNTSNAAVAAAMATNLGITAASVGAANVTVATNYITAQLNAAPGAQGVAVSNILTMWSGLTADPVFGAAATAWNATIANAQTYTNSGAAADTTVAGASAGTTIALTTGVENMTGTAGNDTFNAYILNNANTLQSGDVLNGGAGADTLFADIGTSQAFAITAQTSNIETVQIRAEANATDSNNNNMYPNNAAAPVVGQSNVQIDAQRMAGVNRWESNNSRADVIVEDVRIGAAQITRDITIAFVESDPGNVDLGLYFNQLSLRNSSNSTSVLNLELMDTRSATTGGAPLLSNPYNGFAFGVTNSAGVASLVTLTSPLIDAATTYAQLLAGFQSAIAANPATAGIVTASIINNFTATDTTTGVSAVGQQITLTATGGYTVNVTAAGSGWSAAGVVPANSGLHTNAFTGGSSSAALVTSPIILDDVGMGSTGGDLVVGGMSVGETSTSRGVERFEIEVRDNSKLQTINSTNNALREVTIVNGATSSTPSASGNTAYVTTTLNAGDLTVNGNVNLTSVGTGTTAGTGSDTILKGVNNANAINGYQANHHGAAGFTDVRLIDASTMTGKLAFTAQITSDTIAKYITLVDTQASPTADVTPGNSLNTQGANFVYTGGTNNDTMVVSIDGGVAASRSTIVSGQSDFTFAIDGGNGNDAITVSVVDATNPAGITGTVAAQQNWYNNQNLNNNVNINGGAGDDVIRKPGAGDSNIDAGSGNDAVFTENTGRQAVTVTTGVASTYGAVAPISSAGGSVIANGSNAAWVFNTSDQVNAVATQSARDLFNLRSDTIETYNLYKSALTVTYKGLPSVAVTLSNATSYTTTDYEINQAIKNAINTDPTLKFLLLAQDGPAGSLVVTSLIDGVQVAGDLAIGLVVPVATTLSTVEVAGAAAAYGLAAGSTAAQVVTAMAASLANYTTNADYVAALAQDQAGVNITGANSIRVSDNFVTPGAGNDVIVLGTTAGATLDTSSNEVVVFGAGFGNDVVVHFNAAGVAADHLSFSTWVGNAPTLGALAITNNLVTVAPALATPYTAATLKTAVDALGANAVATSQVYVSVDAHNVGSVFSISNGTALNDAVVTLQGTVDLADTAWGALTVANFATPNATAEGLSGAVPVVPVVPVVPGTTAVAVAAAGASDANAPVGNYVYNVATVAGTYTYNISNFGAGDVLNFGTLNAGTLPSIVADANLTDGIKSFVENTPAGAVTITLTGLTAAQDGAIFNVPSFNTVFGAGSLI